VFFAGAAICWRRRGPKQFTRRIFHIVQLTDSKPVQQLPFDQARGEIAAAVQSEQRRRAVGALIVDLCT
jgi:hypothetical protein